MAHSKLDALPMEVLQTICDFLDVSHKPSVAAISRVNWQCRRAARFVLFRSLTIRIGRAEQLVTDTERWCGILGVNNAFRHVRRLTISDEDAKGRETRRLPLDDGSSWSPLAQLIERLTALKNLVYDCCSPIPSSILQVLQRDQLSGCRLHMLYFGLDCLADTSNSDTSQPLQLNPHELALITSRNLHAIKVGGDTTRTFETEYHLEAIRALVLRCSPSLKEVSYVHRGNGNIRRWESHRLFPGFALPDTTPDFPASRGSLTSLSFECIFDLKLERWQGCTNLDTLQKLTLKIVDAHVLARAATELRFPALKHLNISTVFGQPIDSTATFLQSLPSLTTLTVGSEQVTDVILSTVLQHHGPTLQRLALPYYLCSLSDLHALRASCPDLETLNIKVQRSQGDSAEVALYDCLGSFPLLQHIALHLDCAVRPSEADLRTDPRYSAGQHDDSLHRDLTRQGLINRAVDRDLAASIFRRISHAKPESRPSLKSALLDVTDASVPGAPGARYGCLPRWEIVVQFRRTWTCKPHPRDDWKGEVVVEETESSRRWRKRDEEAIQGRCPSLAGLEPVFRELWPEEKGTDWRDDWCSFPLQESDVQGS